MFDIRLIVTLLLGAVLVPAAACAARPAGGEGPIRAWVDVREQEYALRPDMRGADARQRIQRLVEQGEMPPEAPAVDLVLVLTNTSDRRVTINVGGDMTRVNLELRGPATLTVDPPIAMTMEFRMGRDMPIEPGARYEIPIQSLTHGHRGISKMTYWFEPGEYLLDVSFTTLIDGAEDPVTLVAPPAPLRVVDPKLRAELIDEGSPYVLPAELAEMPWPLRSREGQPVWPGEAPQPPTVKMRLVLTNTTDEPVTLMLGHDGSRIDMSLTGPIATTANWRPMRTREMRMGRPHRLAPGESVTLPIEQLAHGMRGQEMASWWLRPGEYTIRARYTPVIGDDPDSARPSVPAWSNEVTVRVNPENNDVDPG